MLAGKLLEQTQGKRSARAQSQVQVCMLPVMQRKGKADETVLKIWQGCEDHANSRPDVSLVFWLMS